VPFTVADVADRYGLGSAVVTQALERLAGTGRVVSGEFLPGGAGQEWSDAEVLRTLRRRSLAALRKDVEPVPVEALAAFLPSWQHVGSRLRGADGVVRAIEQLQGAQVPASALESLVLPARVSDYSPAMLDELCAAGEVLWRGHGSLPGSDGWVSLHLADSAALTMPGPAADALTTPLHERLVEVLGGGGAYFFRQLSEAVEATDDSAVIAAIWDLVWAGHLSNDTLAPLRVLIGGGGAHRARRSTPRGRYARSRPALGRPAMPSRSGPPTGAGRWALLPSVESDPTRRAHTLAELLLDRYGVVTRGAVMAEGVVGGFAGVYRVLSTFEEAGRCRRGYFVEGLGAAQFALPGAVDRLRATSSSMEQDHERDPDDIVIRADQPRALVLAATDPANPFGAAIRWPARPEELGESGHKPGRKAGALVVVVDDRLALYVERGGRTLLTWSNEPRMLEPAVDALALAVREGHLGRMTVQRADGAGVLDSDLGRALEAAGFSATPRGLRLRS
jgi:ATP-dependent Lhr-like helicase